MNVENWGGDHVPPGAAVGRGGGWLYQWDPEINRIVKPRKNMGQRRGGKKVKGSDKEGGRTDDLPPALAGCSYQSCCQCLPQPPCESLGHPIPVPGPPLDAHLLLFGES